MAELPERQPFPAERKDFIIFGDMCDASYWTHTIDWEKDEITFEFRPSPYMKWKHQIQNWEKDQVTDRIKKTFKRCLCIDGSTSGFSHRFLILQDYHGKMTKLFELINQRLYEKSEFYFKKYHEVNNALLKIQYELNMNAKHPENQQAKIMEIVKSTLQTAIQSGNKNG